MEGYYLHPEAYGQPASTVHIELLNPEYTLNMPENYSGKLKNLLDTLDLGG